MWSILKAALIKQTNDILHEKSMFSQYVRVSYIYVASFYKVYTVGKNILLFFILSSISLKFW